MTVADVGPALDRVRALAGEVRDVDPTLRRLGAVVAALCCRDLDIPTVRVRWLAPDARGRRGVTYPEHPGEAWVRAGQTVAATIETTAHECRHAWQLQPDGYRWAMRGLQTDAEREGDARDYGLAVRDELTGGR